MKSRLQVLLIEDSADDAGLIVGELERGGFEVNAARVETVRAKQEKLAESTWDLVLADYTLPQFGAVAALLVLGQSTQDPPFIIVSGTIGEEAAVAAMRAGACDYVMKNRLSRLVPVVERELAAAAERQRLQAAERQSRRDQERLRALVEKSVEGIAVVDREGRVTYSSPSAVRPLGFSAEETLGRSVFDFVWSDDRAWIRADFDGLQHTPGAAIAREVRAVRKDGACRWVDLIATNLQHDPAVEGTVINNRDVTERKQLEAQLLRAQRLESIGALASGIAHDLNNVLAPILMGAPLLRASASDPTSARLLQSIESSARRGADIVKQVLTFARGVEGQRAPLQARHLLYEMEKIAVETFPKNIRIESEAAADLLLVRGDATQLHQALMNLCINARDAMPEGGRLTLSARNVDLDRKAAAAVPAGRPGSFVCLAVVDTGTGIAPEIRDRIFEPFFTTKAVGQGTGLGLATVLGVARNHAGFLRLETAPGRGSTFELYLPALPAGTAAEGPEPPTPLPHGHGELLLIVDDEAAVREVVRQALLEFGYQVITCIGGAEALAVFRERRRDIHLVLTDLMMPEMDGIGLVRALRAIDPLVRIIGLTGVSDKASREPMKALDLPALLAKPVTVSQLLAAVHEVLGPAAEVPAIETVGA